MKMKQKMGFVQIQKVRETVFVLCRKLKVEIDGLDFRELLRTVSVEPSNGLGGLDVGRD